MMRDSSFVTGTAALQSMLKTTTETGDIGRLSVRSIRPLPITFRDSNRDANRDHNPNYRQNDSFTGAHKYSSDYRPELRPFPNGSSGPYGPTSMSDVVRLRDGYGNYQAASDGYSYRTSGSQSSRRGLRSTQPLVRHLSYTTLRSRDAGSDVMNRPWSPYANPPQRYQGPFRPPSPNQMQTEWMEQHGPPMVRGSSGRTLPSASFPAQAVIPLRLRRDQAYAMGSSYSQVSIVNHHHRQGRLSPRVALRKKANGLSSRTPSPLYYDYTEEFEEQEDYRTVNASVVSLPLSAVKASLDQRMLGVGYATQSPPFPTRTTVDRGSTGDEAQPRKSQSALPFWDYPEQPPSIPGECTSNGPEALRKSGTSTLQHTRPWKNHSVRERQHASEHPSTTWESPARVSKHPNGAKSIPVHYYEHDQRALASYCTSNGVSAEAEKRTITDNHDGQAVSRNHADLRIWNGAHHAAVDRRGIQCLRSGDRAFQVHAPRPERPVSSDSYQMRFGHLDFVDQNDREESSGEPAVEASGTSLEHWPFAYPIESSEHESQAAPISMTGRSKLSSASDSPVTRDDVYSVGSTRCLRPPPAPSHVGYNLKPSQIVEIGRAAALKEQQSINGSLNIPAGTDSSPPRPETSSTDMTETARVLKLKAIFPWLANELTFFTGESSVSLALSNPSVSVRPPFSFVSSGLHATTSVSAKAEERFSQDLEIVEPSPPTPGLPKDLAARFKLKLRRRFGSRFGFGEKKVKHTESETSLRDPIGRGASISAPSEGRDKPPKFKLKIRRASRSRSVSIHTSPGFAGTARSDDEKSCGGAMMSGGSGQTSDGVLNNDRRNPSGPADAHPVGSGPSTIARKADSTPRITNRAEKAKTFSANLSSYPPQLPSESRSFFSDDSSVHRKPTSSLRKRISSLKSKIPMPRTGSSSTHPSIENSVPMQDRPSSAIPLHKSTLSNSATLSSRTTILEQPRRLNEVVRDLLRTIKRKLERATKKFSPRKATPNKAASI